MAAPKRTTDPLRPKQQVYAFYDFSDVEEAVKNGWRIVSMVVIPGTHFVTAVCE